MPTATTPLACQSASFTNEGYSYGHKHQLLIPKPIHHLGIFKVNANPFLLSNQRVGLFNDGLRFQDHCKRKMNMTVHCNAQPGAPVPFNLPGPGSWKIWLIGMVISLLVPSWRKKLWLFGPLHRLREKFETAIDVAEHVADVVEDVAEKVDKVAEELADNLPEGRLKNFARFVEKTAEEIDEGAEKVEEVLDKMEEVENQVEAFLATKEDSKATNTPKDVRL